MMHKRTRACAISKETRKRVEERDGHCCIFCGRPGRGESHVIPRSHGGLGIEQNIITVCRPCHYNMDDTISRPFYLELARQYLSGHYPGWNPQDLIYKKGEKTKAEGLFINKKLVNNCIPEDRTRANGESTKEPPEGFRFIEGEVIDGPDHKENSHRTV